MVTWNLQQQLNLEANRHVIERQTKDNLESGEEYARLIETLYRNLMLDKQVLRIKEKPTGHRSFLLQEVVRHEVWIRGLHWKT
jgi:predicted translin family RNA/ssDNA-binding protein